MCLLDYRWLALFGLGLRRSRGPGQPHDIAEVPALGTDKCPISQTSADPIRFAVRVCVLSWIHGLTGGCTSQSGAARRPWEVRERAEDAQQRLV